MAETAAKARHHDLADAAQVRALAPQDLARVEAIDALWLGRPRSRYFERRLAAAQRQPGLHVQLGAVVDGRLCGFVLGRVLEGEFGRAEPALRLEAIGIDPVAEGRGLGLRLNEALEAEARRHGVRELRTGAHWREHGMLGFLDRAGWSLGRNYVLDCALADATWGGDREMPVSGPVDTAPRDPNDYSGPAGNDYETLARDVGDIAVLGMGDLEGIQRIDRRLTGRDRGAYLRHALEEAMADSSVRVSLAARADQGLAGYVMARVDLGDFGRRAPVAVIDAIGVDPMRKEHGFGHALMSQLFVNLRALGVERIETVVAPDNFELLHFFLSAGLRPSDRLAFAKRLG
ncbi:MAG: GNAT family N-acetyltransferase [Gammaproteobacteria bacterium]|nr:GNAT family N-acetyltransferase [Gammaproteobacteria bacterium]